MLKHQDGAGEELVLNGKGIGLSASPGEVGPADKRGLSNQAVPETKTDTRRRFTRAYRQRIVEQADACSEPGEIGALLRREGLYSSNLSRFRTQLASGRLDEAACERRKQATQDRALQKQRETRIVARLERENQRLRAIIDLQKKIGELLNLPMEEEPPHGGRS
jgi:transposase-like protein